MKIKLQRFSDNGESTLGLFFINDKFRCFTKENNFPKSQIDVGNYFINLKKDGRLHEKYLRRFPDLHKGILEFSNYSIIPFDEDNKNLSCIFPGDWIKNNITEIGRIDKTTQAYYRIYEEIVGDIMKGEDVEIKIIY